VDQQMPDQVLSFCFICFHQLFQSLLNVAMEKRIRNFLANQQLGGITPCFMRALLKVDQIIIELHQFLLLGHGRLGSGGGDSHDGRHDGGGLIYCVVCWRVLHN